MVVFDIVYVMSDRICFGIVKRGNKMCCELNLVVFVVWWVFLFIYWFFKFGGVLELFIF